MDVQTKSMLREQLQGHRSAISRTMQAASGEAIIERLIQVVDWREVRWLHCYAPIKSRGEVDTWPLFTYVWEHWPHIKTAVPGRLRADQPTAYMVDATSTWYEAGAAPLPKEKIPVADQLFDVIVIPCLGFDEDHYRLGYGGGYYDRLIGTQTKAEAIGLAYWAGYVTEGLPHERHDVPLQRIITEERIL